MPRVAIRIADEGGNPLAAGEVGELLVGSPFVCGGYWQRPQKTASSLRNGWWHTGDLTRIDDEGFVWIAGRKKDMIISGAENICPSEVESVMAELDGVVEVAVIGVPDEEWGEAVAAYIVRRIDGAITAADVLTHYRNQAAAHSIYRCSAAQRSQQGVEERASRDLRIAWQWWLAS